MSNPQGWMDGTFPKFLFVGKPAENQFIKNGDIIYSAFEMDGKLYAIYANHFRAGNIVLRAYSNSNETVKTGINKDEQPRWVLQRNTTFTEIEISSTYKENGYNFVKLKETGKAVELFDNPYYSQDPVWPSNLNLLIKKPTPLKPYTLPQLQYTSGKDYRIQMPKYLTGLEFVKDEGDYTLKVSRYLTASVFTFLQSDIERGFIKVKIKGVPLINSTSTDTERVYSVYFS